MQAKNSVTVTVPEAFSLTPLSLSVIFEGSAPLKHD